MYRRSIQLAPASALAYKNLGTALLVQHNFKKGWKPIRRRFRWTADLPRPDQPKVADPVPRKIAAP